MKRSSPQKKFGMGYVKMHVFHGNPYMILEKGGRPKKFNHI